MNNSSSGSVDDEIKSTVERLNYLMQKKEKESELMQNNLMNSNQMKTAVTLSGSNRHHSGNNFSHSDNLLSPQNEMN